MDTTYHETFVVTQDDRDAAERIGLLIVNALAKAGYVGIYFEQDDSGSLVQAFARHRTESISKFSCQLKNTSNVNS